MRNQNAFRIRNSRVSRKKDETESQSLELGQWRAGGSLGSRQRRFPFVRFAVTVLIQHCRSDTLLVQNIEIHTETKPKSTAKRSVACLTAWTSLWTAFQTWQCQVLDFVLCTLPAACHRLGPPSQRNTFTALFRSSFFPTCRAGAILSATASCSLLDNKLPICIGKRLPVLRIVIRSNSVQFIN